MSRMNGSGGGVAPPPRWSARAYFVCDGFSNDMFNALTACLPLALFWRGAHLGADVLGVSCFVFCVVAAAGHVWPRALAGSTHLVKLAFTLRGAARCRSTTGPQ